MQVPKLLENILKLDFDTAIAGRGEPMTRADVQAYKTKWDTFMSRAREAIKKGVEETKKEVREGVHDLKNATHDAARDFKTHSRDTRDHVADQNNEDADRQPHNARRCCGGRRSEKEWYCQVRACHLGKFRNQVDDDDGEARARDERREPLCRIAHGVSGTGVTLDGRQVDPSPVRT